MSEALSARVWANRSAACSNSFFLLEKLMSSKVVSGATRGAIRFMPLQGREVCPVPADYTPAIVDPAAGASGTRRSGGALGRLALQAPAALMDVPGLFLVPDDLAVELV